MYSVCSLLYTGIVIHVPCWFFKQITWVFSWEGFLLLDLSSSFCHQEPRDCLWPLLDLRPQSDLDPSAWLWAPHPDSGAGLLHSLLHLQHKMNGLGLKRIKVWICLGRNRGLTLLTLRGRIQQRHIVLNVLLTRQELLVTRLRDLEIALLWSWKLDNFMSKGQRFYMADIFL